eukprot:CAMPEP_0195592834 /NCGR_PEP_ID=MMETSP0815-20121206/563_1 /TAXON_ID=97485 /ORGANISM="Prymnesium parvum, Strain Texoma1" /LENGTH=61 /DNA_ID=CAMNT_0040731935 /DNA_START=49 /DNA_END=231 /DNA_ORIENTATION=+
MAGYVPPHLRKAGVTAAPRAGGSSLEELMQRQTMGDSGGGGRFSDRGGGFSDRGGGFSDRG